MQYTFRKKLSDGGNGHPIYVHAISESKAWDELTNKRADVENVESAKRAYVLEGGDRAES